MIKFTNNNHIKKCDCALGLLNINYCEVYKVNYASGEGYKKIILLVWYNKPEKTDKNYKIAVCFVYCFSWAIRKTKLN